MKAGENQRQTLWSYGRLGIKTWVDNSGSERDRWNSRNEHFKANFWTFAFFTMDITKRYAVK